MIRTVTVLILLTVCSAGARGLDTPEFWAGQNKDGNSCNSNARSISGNLRVRWAANLRGFDKATAGDYWLDPRFSINVSVRNSRVLIAVPTTDPVASYYPGRYTTYGIFSLANGQVLSSRVNPMVGPDGLIWQFWKADGTVYTESETDDVRSNARFNPYTGEVPFGLPSHNCTFAGDSSWLNSTSGGIGGFTMTDSNPLLYGCAGSFDQGGGNGRSECGLLDTGAMSESSWKWQLPLLQGNRAYIMKAAVPTSNAGYITYPLYGQAIEALNMQASPFSAQVAWNYVDATRQQISNALISPDGHIYYYAVNLNSSGAVVYSAGETLVGVRTSDGVADVSIPVAFDMSADGGVPHQSGYYVNTGQQIITYAQSAVLGNQVIIFTPELDVPNSGHVFCFNTSTQTLAWRKDFAPGYFDPVDRINIYGSVTYPARMTVAGDSAYIVNAQSVGGSLTLKVDRLNLSSGANTTTTLTPRDAGNQTIAISSATSVLLQDVAAVDGALVCLVSYDTINQALVVVDGDTNPAYAFPPVAVISAPLTGTPMLNQQHLSDGTQIPSNQFDSGVLIGFSSAGSFDPAGGALTYSWNFGNGSTSSSANPSFAYPSTGNPGTVTNRTVTLTVTNSAGNSSTATRTVAVRDVGSNQTLTFLAIADTYVDSASVFVDSNFGTQPTMFYLSDGTPERGYVQFNLMSTAPASISAATLRLWVPPSSSVNTTMNARACSNNWTETGTTWNNSPAPGAIVGSKVFNYLPMFGFYVDIPVTAYVQSAQGSNGLLTIEVEPADAGSHILIGAREGGNPAQLIVQVSNSGPLPPVITSATSGSGTVGTAFSYSITATNSPTSFSASGLPAGLSVNTSTGVISGTPTVAGTSNATINATNAAGTGSATLTLTISPALPPPPVITSATSASGTVGTAFSYTITATNSPTSFSALGLPAGLSVNASTGVISGTPTAAGTSSVTIKATNAGGTGSATLTLTVNSGTPTATATYVTTDTTTQGTWKGTYGVDGYAIQADSTNYPAYATVSFINSALFTWASSTTDVRGLQKAASTTDRIAACWYNNPTYSIDVNLSGTTKHRVALYCLDWDTTARAQTIEIDDAGTGVALDGPRALSNYNGGKYVTWDISGHVVIKLVCTGGFNAVVSGIFFGQATLPPAPVVTSATNASGTVGTAFSYAITATNSPTSFNATGLPAGLSVNTSTGVISGTPTAAGTASVTISATNAGGTGSTTLTLTIAPSSGGGGVLAWGYNSNGQLGDGTTTQRNTPVTIAGLSGVQTVAMGLSHTLALMNDGTVMAWGDNTYGQLGTGASSLVPVTIPNLSGVKGIAAGAYHSVVVLNDGTVRAWGYNGYGEVGNPSSLTNVKAVAAGGYHSLALLNDGTVRAWGNNADGELGNGSTVNSGTPVVVSGLSGVTSLVAGLLHSEATLSDGTMRAWGQNGYGQLGDGTVTNRTTPVVVTGVGNVKNVACGAYYTVIALNDGTMEGWGDNNYGSLGDGTQAQRNAPVTISGMNGVASLGCAYHTTLAQMSDGTLRACGDNTRGEFGDNAAEGYRFTFGTVPGVSGLTAIFAGGSQSMALTGSSNPVAPAITTQPVSQTVTAGQTATFSVAAAGTAPLSYQWKQNGTNISGATASSYTTPATTTADNGAIFTVVVSNSAGSVTSSNATLTVNSSSGPTTVVLQDGLNGYTGTRDTYMYRPWASVVLGTQTALITDDVDSILVRFAIFQAEGGPVPNGATIDSATLGLYKSYYYNYTGSPRRVLKNWIESEATWNNANASTPWSVPGAAGSGTDIAAAADGSGTVGWNPGWLAIDVTTGTQAFAAGTSNYGWYLSGVAGNAINFYSREYATDPTLRPKLTITYHGGTPGALAIAAPSLASSSSMPGSLTVSKLQGSANFTASHRDTLSVQGAVKLPTSFTSAGQTALLSINGARARFKLDAKGRAKSADGSFALKSGVFTAKLLNGTWAGTWGLNPNASANAKMSFSATLWIGSNVFSTNVTVSCVTKAKVGAKLKK